MRLPPLDRNVIDNYLSKRQLDVEAHVLDEIDSTNALARERAAAGAPDGSLVVAETQRAGRGREGRRWLSPPGAGLWMSMVRRGSFPAARGGLVPLAVGVAVARALERAHGIAVGVKWPNDVMAAGRKLGGILVESATSGEVLSWIVIGIGINLLVVRALPDEVARHAISLEALGVKAIDRHALLNALHEEVMRVTTELGTGDGRAMREAFAALDVLRDRRVSVNEGGRVLLSGIARGIDPSGALLVEREGERVSVRVGSVRLA